MTKRTAVAAACALLAATTVLAGTFRRYRIATASDAPTLLPGDVVIANTSAYALTVPFSWVHVASVSEPRRGDMVICRLPSPAPGAVCVKRVVGLPGDEIEIQNHRLCVNGHPVGLRELDRAESREFDERGQLGQVVALESGIGREHMVTYSPALPSGHGPVTVGPGRYFVLGDNRDNSLDSRQLGTVPRSWILGKVVGQLACRHR